MNDLNECNNHLKSEKKRILTEIIDYSIRNLNSANADAYYSNLISRTTKNYKDVRDLLNDFINPLEISIFRRYYGRPCFIDYLAFEECYKEFIKTEIQIAEIKNNRALTGKERFEIFLRSTEKFLAKLSPRIKDAKKIRDIEGLNFYSLLADSFLDNPEILDIVKKAEMKEKERLKNIDSEKRIAIKKLINTFESKLKNE
ncbi:MAG: hypothetical protein ACP5H9_04390 [Candidatus Woesearchaeota archaeon]